jgi:hypothetical protein
MHTGTRRPGAARLPFLLLLAAACCALPARAEFRCCTGCSGDPPPACCSGLFGGIENDAAQCAALEALYAAAGGPGWHLNYDWEAAQQAGYGGANVPGARIEVINPRIEPPAKLATIADVIAALPGRGYDYYDAWKYEYDATETKEVFTEDGRYSYTDEYGATEFVDVWPNAAQLAQSFQEHAKRRTGGWATAATDTPTDYCTFYGVFCTDAGDVLILCAAPH